MPAPAVPRFARRFAGPLLLGLLGLAALPLQLIPQLAARPLPEQLAALPATLLIALSLLNPLILLAVTCTLGAALAHRSGLGSAAAGTVVLPGRGGWALPVALGLATAAAIAALDALWAPWLGPQAQALQAHGAGSLRQLLVGALYGGLAEEVMMRWGFMSLIAWALARTLARGQAEAPAWVFVAAIVIAALLFAAGHLPALMATLEPTPALVLRTLLLNTLAGLVYGWLFWRRQLESAMAAHAATHLGFWLIALVL